MTLIEFLRARIAEDEAAAESCPPYPWRVAAPDDEQDDGPWAGEDVVSSDGEKVAEVFALSGNQTRAVLDHVVIHNPARVLTECKAKRLILDEHEPSLSRPSHCLCDGEAHPCPTARALALPYANHPDFDPSWSMC